MRIAVYFLCCWPGLGLICLSPGCGLRGLLGWACRHRKDEERYKAGVGSGKTGGLARDGIGYIPSIPSTHKRGIGKEGGPILVNSKADCVKHGKKHKVL